MVLFNPPDKMAFWKVAADESPRFSTICTLNKIGLVVTGFMVIEASVGDIGIMPIGFDVVDKKVLGNTKDFFGDGPVVSAIFGDMNQTIIGPRVE